MFFKPQHLHFTGIGGIGMSGIAEVLLNLGYTVSGSDLKLGPITDRLAALGARVFEGHHAENVGDARALVITSAVKDDNPELIEARRRQIPVIPRGELLAELMRLKFGIAIGGSHGKTTTTSMTASILSSAGFDPTVVVGGRVKTMGGSNARVGRSDFLLVESDESDGSFLKLAPIIAVVTNIDHEHLDHYKSFERVLDAFAEFVNRVPFYGAAILCLDDPNVQRILPHIRRRTITYGTSAQADIRIAQARYGSTGSEFELRPRGADAAGYRLNVAGAHNVLNATAAIAVARELEAPVSDIQRGLAAYAGVDRRMQVRGVANGVTVMDDYGHHPTEVRATLDAVRLGGFERVLVLFQPHRYTRTQMLLDEFARSFHAADRVWVLDVYAASEPPIEGVSGQALAARLAEFGHRGASYVGGLDAGAAAVAAAAGPGDLVLTLGAGSVSQAGERILSLIREK
ncbi:MAG: UDP-N-acetylmuramate--L-alanine ligase [Acidobacteria bacterium]|nr:UDP-N-acetylmuramate--L-alanine ligase [Acidobacteriota bacterium]